MSTWISKAALLPLVLAGCVAVGGGGGVVRFAAGEGDPGFAVAAPAGFCVTGQSAGGGAAFAAFARCAGSAGEPALLTATVGAPGSGAGGTPDAAALAEWFRSDAGRRALSRSGQAATVTLHEVVAAEDAVILRLTDVSRAGPAVEGESFRAIAAVGGRLVTLSATGGPGAPLARDGGRRLIGAFLAALRRANR